MWAVFISADASSKASATRLRAAKSADAYRLDDVVEGLDTDTSALDAALLSLLLLLLLELVLDGTKVSSLKLKVGSIFSYA